MRRTVLIVDDNRINREVLKNTLKKEYELLEAANGKDALDIMKQHYETLSAVLLDVVMPVMDGYEALEQISQDARLIPIPVIIVTGETDEQSRTKALKCGASDFLVKPFTPEIILHCLKNNIALRETTSIVNTMRVDQLTGLYNQDTFFEIADERVQAKEPGYYVLSFLNIDNFKIINDQYGRRIGDLVLKHVAGCLSASMPAEDGICCRLTGDKFAALFPVAYIGDRALDLFHQKSTHPDCIEQTLTVRIGRCVASDLSLPVSSMLDRAALAEASIKGKYNLYIAEFDESMRQTLIDEQQIVNDMADALRLGEFEPWFQPQYNHADGALIGAEALVRWRRGGTIIPPYKFIPAFEKNGFIYEMDKSIWEQTCACLRKWIDLGYGALPISVNVSRQDIFRPDLFDVITGLLKKYDLPMHLLRLEVTESAFSENSDVVVAIVKKLIDHGFTVEIDDFGSGYSSLNTLKDVPAQILKLDMKFFANTDNSQRGGNIVESVVRMAKWIGMSVIAEGVEEPAQADYLKSIGCVYIQGYLYAKPMPLNEYEALLKREDKESEMTKLETVYGLDNNAFWDPNSLDSLIFNSYVGAACIWEYSEGKLEVVRVTDDFVRMFDSSELTAKVLLGLDFMKYTNDAENVKFANAEAMQRGTFTGEFCFIGLPGCPHETWLRSTMRVIATAGSRYLMYCLSENITAQREAERHERKAAEQLQALLDNINGGVSAVTLAEDGTITILFANNQYYEMFGYTKEIIEREHIDLWAISHPDDRERIRGSIDQLFSDHIPVTYDYRCIKRDGSIIYVRCNAAVTAIDGIDGYVLISDINDITEERANLEQLRISEETNRLAIEHSATVVCRFNIAERTLQTSPNINPGFHMPRLINNLPYSSIETGDISPETVKDYKDFYERIIRGEKMVNSIFQRRSTDGWRWIEAHSSTIFSDDGAPVSAVISFIDITGSMEKELAYELRQKSLQAKDQSTYVLYRCNVSKKDADLEQIGGTLECVKVGAGTINAWDRTQIYACACVREDYRSKYLKLLDPDLLLANYYRGTNLDSLDYPEMLPDGSLRWLRLSVELAGRPDSNDVEAYLMFENIDAAKKEELEIRHRAETDPLTGLYNRNAFTEYMRQDIAVLKPNAASALLVIDLDGFKLVNDRFGHAVGDQTLIEIAQKLRSAFRQQDLICRLGGDEFMVFMNGVTSRSVVSDKARLVCAMLHKSFSIEVQLSASIGIAMFPDDGPDLDTLYHKADQALYHIKNEGKDGFALYTESMESVIPPEKSPETAQTAAADLEYITPKRRMLIVEDNELNRDFLTGLFEDEFLIDTAAEGTAALIRLRRYGSGISIVLLDLTMPGISGFDVLDQMQKSVLMRPSR